MRFVSRNLRDAREKLRFEEEAKLRDWNGCCARIAVAGFAASPQLTDLRCWQSSKMSLNRVPDHVDKAGVARPLLPETGDHRSPHRSLDARHALTTTTLDDVGHGLLESVIAHSKLLTKNRPEAQPLCR